MALPSRLIGLLLACGLAPAIAPPEYRPALRSPETLEPFLKDVAPGGDSFPEEKEAAELAARLEELGEPCAGVPETPPA